MTTIILLAAVLLPLAWLARRLQGVLVALRRMPDPTPHIPDERPWEGLAEVLRR
jgi:hypothetical protein